MAMASPQFQQLPMFMSAREIKSRYSPWPGDFEEHEDGSAESPREVWDRKYNESLDFGLHRSVLKDGVKHPVALQAGGADPLIMGGHHRIEVMSRNRPDALMPVEHFEDFWDAQKSQGSRER